MLYFALLLVIYIGIYAILSLSLNLIAGYAGLLSLCHAAFFGIGAYVTAIGLVTYGGNFWIMLLLSGFVAAFFGFLIGLPTLRLKGDYLAIATLGFGEIVRNVIINWDAVTRGPMGISGLPAPSFFGIPISPLNKWSFIVLVWIFVLITYLLLRRLMRSRIGRALEAIREDEIAAFAMGINVVKYKIFAFAVGAFFAGVAGSLYAVYNQSVNANSFDFMFSVMILSMVVLGGLGNHIAAILGASIIVLASELPRLLGLSAIVPAQARQILFGAILVGMMLYRPQGILGRKKPDFEKAIQKHTSKEAQT